MLASNQADVVIAGGCETLSKEIVDAQDEPGVGFADGACFVVLEHEDRVIARGTTYSPESGRDSTC